VHAGNLGKPGEFATAKSLQQPTFRQAFFILNCVRTRLIT
jgi:hypothetical protein